MSKCIGRHEAAKKDPALWQELAYLGRQSAFDPENPGLELELRNCQECGTTLAIEVGGKTA